MLKELYKKYLLNHYKLIIKISCLILIGAISFFIVYSYSRKKLINNELKKDISIIEDGKSEELVEISNDIDEYCYVDIKGAIVNPDVYKIKKDSRIIDVVKLAGGLTNEADTSTLNLSKKISDEMFVIIYTKAEIEKFKSKDITITEIIKYIENDCNCPDPSINDSCITKEKDENGDSNNNSSKVSLNTSTKEILMTLPGIGETKAVAIIEYRNKNGLFKNVEDIKKVTGIGDSTFDKIKDFITL